MTHDEIRAYLDGFHAWDMGVVDSGIKDEVAREEVRLHLIDLAEGSPGEFHDVVWPYLFDQIQRDDGIESAQERLDWLREYLGFDDWSGL